MAEDEPLIEKESELICQCKILRTDKWENHYEGKDCHCKEFESHKDRMENRGKEYHSFDYIELW